MANIKWHYTPPHNPSTQCGTIGHCWTTKFVIIFSECGGTHSGQSDSNSGGIVRYSPGRCEWGNLGNWLNQLIIIFGRHVRVAIKSICWSFRRRRLPPPSIQKHRHHPSTYHPATPTGWEIIIQVGLLALLLKSSLPAIQHYCRFPLTVLASFPVARTRGDDDDDGGGGEGDDDCYNQAQSFHLCISTWGYYWQFCSGKLLFTICPFPLVALPPPYHPLSRSNLNSIPILQCSPCIVIQFPRGQLWLWFLWYLW